FSVSADGTILFGGGSDRLQLTWFNREGRALSTVGRPDHYVGVRISPDGGRASAAITDQEGKRDLWIVDLTRGLPNRLTHSGAVGAAIWSPSGDRLIYHTLGGLEFFTVPVSGAGQESSILKHKEPAYVSDTSPDGRLLVYDQAASAGYDVW